MRLGRFRRGWGFPPVDDGEDFAELALGLGLGAANGEGLPLALARGVPRDVVGDLPEPGVGCGPSFRTSSTAAGMLAVGSGVAPARPAAMATPITQTATPVERKTILGRIRCASSFVRSQIMWGSYLWSALPSLARLYYPARRGARVAGPESRAQMSQRLLEHATAEADKGSRLQTSEKIWGAVAQTCK